LAIALDPRLLLVPELCLAGEGQPKPPRGPQRRGLLQRVRDQPTVLP